MLHDVGNYLRDHPWKCLEHGGFRSMSWSLDTGRTVRDRCGVGREIQIGDIYVGDYNARQDEVDGSGRGYLFSGRSGRRLDVLRPESPCDGFGPARSVDDIDGDGVRELFAAAYTWTDGSNAGRGYLYSGAPRELLRTLTGTLPEQYLGVDALGLGDVDGDRLGELMLTGGGVLHVVAGRPKSGG